MDSNVGLAIQCVGVLLITLLSLFMRSSIKSNALRYWTAAWASLSLALLSLFIGFQLAPRQTIFYSGYFLGEHLFGLLFIAGCRSQMLGASLTAKHKYFLIPALVVALVLPHASADFNESIHATRQSLKRIRALLALVRDELGDKVFEHERDCYRGGCRHPGCGTAPTPGRPGCRRRRGPASSFPWWSPSRPCSAGPGRCTWGVAP